MSNKLVIIFSGKKQAGKSSACKFVLTEFINAKIGKKRFILDKVGKEVVVLDTFSNNKIVHLDTPSDESSYIADTYSVKMYSFADPLKRLCIDTLGLDPIQCYGTDDDKNSSTHLSWENIFSEVREKYSRPRRGSGGYKPASGNMTAREVMQVIGTDIFRRLDNNCWARSLYSIIEQEGYELSLISDARFPNEITLGTENNGKAIRLLRKVNEDNHDSEIALDNFPLGEYNVVLDNQDKTMAETHKIIKGYVNEYFKQYRLI
jgi:hypothetical protein